MTHYIATASREGKWWLVRIPEIDGLTQARRLADAELMAREYVAVTLDVDLETVAVTVAVGKVAGVNVADGLAEIRREREQAADLERDALARAGQLAKALAGADVPVRDIGTVLGVSFQRAHQLVKS